MTGLMEWIQLATGMMLTGLIWIVQRVTYPGLAEHDPATFHHHHRLHVRRITPVVAPLMLAELAAALVLLFLPGTLPHPLQQALTACVILAWLSTFTLQVPIHHKLEQGHDAVALRRLIATNWLRTAAWTTKTVLLTWAEMN